MRNVLIVIIACVLCSPGVAAMMPNKKPMNNDLLPMPDELPRSLTPQRPLADDRPTQASAFPHAPNTGLEGIDVSHYQGHIDWKTVAKSGEVSYAYIKATEGATLVDDTYRRNLIGARQVGIHVGVYHFYRPNVSPQLQLANFTQNVNLFEMDLVPIIDIELRGKEPLATFRTKLKRFLDAVEHHYGVRPILYTSRDFYNKYLSGPFTDYKYMIARYHTDVPELCDNAAFVMWQYSAMGSLNGINTHVDRSCFMDSYTLSDILLKR